VEADVYVWCYALLVVHARKEGKENAHPCWWQLAHLDKEKMLSMVKRESLWLYGEKSSPQQYYLHHLHTANTVSLRRSNIKAG